MLAHPTSRLNTVSARPEGSSDDSASTIQRGEWDALMTAAQAGHGGAYQRLLTEISAWLVRYFRRRLPAGDVDDAVQEALLAIHRRRHTYDPRRPFAPWLAAIAKRKWIDQLRGMGRQPSEELPSDIPTDDHETAVTSASVLTSLLDELRPTQAQAITLVKLQGYSIDDVVQQTGMSASAVKMNIHRGLARLTAILEKTDDID